MKARIKCNGRKIIRQGKRHVTGLHVCKNVSREDGESVEKHERIQFDVGCHRNAVTRKWNVLRAQPALHIY